MSPHGGEGIFHRRRRGKENTRARVGAESSFHILTTIGGPTRMENTVACRQTGSKFRRMHGGDGNGGHNLSTTLFSAFRLRRRRRKSRGLSFSRPCDRLRLSSEEREEERVWGRMMHRCRIRPLPRRLYPSDVRTLGKKAPPPSKI